MSPDSSLQPAQAASGPPSPAASQLFDTLAGKALCNRRLDGLRGADSALVLASIYRRDPGTYLWLGRSNRDLETMAANLRLFLPGECRNRVLVLPGSEADPYRGLSPHPEIAAARAAALWKILRWNQGLILTTLTALTPRLPSPQTFMSQCLDLETGRFLPPDHLTRTLDQVGYVREEPVGTVGEYSVRGGIVDVFPPSSSAPVRIEFFGDEIESIREFDPNSQRSVALVPGCRVVPMRELSVTARDISRWHREAPNHWSEVRFAQALEEKLQFTVNGELFNGFEALFPLVVPTRHHLLDFVQAEGRSSPTLVLSEWDELRDEHTKIGERWEESYRERTEDGDLVLPPDRLYWSAEVVESWTKKCPSFYLSRLFQGREAVERFDFRTERQYSGQLRALFADLAEWTRRERVVFVMKTPGMVDRLVDIFREYDIHLHRASGFASALDHGTAVIQGRLSQGFHSPALGLHLLGEENLFAGSLRPPAPPRTKSDPVAAFLSDFRDLKSGDYVVHVDHGIGLFQGLRSLGVGGDTREFLVVGFRGDDKLYVPADRLDQIQKYSSSGESRPRLDRLGGASWDKTKKRIKKSMRSMAADLLKLYAQREVARGHAFPEDDALVREFEAAFPYEETPDQAAAIEAVKKDMMAPRPMDRLVCGDVGYGKTEVAMRAAFRSVNDSKQVAVLTPTTVLALQHYNTFCERFQGFPVSIEMISRLRNRSQQREILQNTESGKTDVLIGTHRLLSRDVRFRDLGLIVVDEEQRFGVAQKERLKRLKTRVDVLNLSATPIPRTLSMSLTGVRDLSIIETPPKDRLAIQTAVVRFSRSLIRTAIDLELKRQGQVFLVHNSVETIYSMARMIQDTVPEARVAVGHGQMRENQLEKVMLDFLDYRYDVLVATTIIENGLDIPRANTLLVNRAHRFGLAQLYQLRGRVGRSNRRAYAYLLIPSEETLSTDAAKRLAAIREFSDLGSGFRIAAMDLEIRGSGNLLGQEQHGHINAVGFELYLKLLQEAVRELKGEETAEEIQISIDLGLDIHIPQHYIADPSQRLWLYKRLSILSSRSSLENLKEEVEDRFGKYPRSVSNLFEYGALRLGASRLRISSIDLSGERISLRFRDDTPVSPHDIVALVQGRTDLTLTQGGVLNVRVPSSDPATLFACVGAVLERIGERIGSHGIKSPE